MIKTSGHSRNRTPNSIAVSSVTRLVTSFFCAVSAVTCLMIPVDFVIVTPLIARAVYYLSAITLVVVLAHCALSPSNPIERAVLLLLAVSLAPALASGSAGVLAGLYIALPITVGMFVSRVVEMRMLPWIAAVMTVVLLTEYVSRLYWYSELFGQLRFASYLATAFRARGIIGQAVPSAFVLVILAAVSVVYSDFRRDRFLAGRLIILLACVAVGLFVTGTRSALLGALLAIAMLAYTFRHDIPAAAAAATLSVAAIVAVATGVFNPSLSRTRLFSFGNLANSASGSNRRDAFSVINRISDSCGVGCDLFGHGGRALQRSLASGSSLYDLSTVDNQFVAVFWDFGLLGLAAILSLFVVAALNLRHNNLRARKAGGLICVLVLASGFSYDSLYTRPSGLLLGLGIGLLLGSEKTLKHPTPILKRKASLK